MASNPRLPGAPLVLIAAAAVVVVIAFVIIVTVGPSSERVR